MSVVSNGQVEATNSLSPADQSVVERAIRDGARAYFAARRERIPDFVKQHFSGSAAMRLNRRALGWDLLRGPANLMWAAPYLLGRIVAAALRRLGWPKAAGVLDRLPVGFPTCVQREVEWLVYSQLLELPINQLGRQCRENALMQAIVSQPELATLLESYVTRINERASDPSFEHGLRQQLGRYAGARLAVADLTSGVLTLSAGWAVLNQITPGALSTGSAIAVVMAKQSAIASFILGPGLGSLYYSIFPAQASVGLVVGSTIIVLVALGMLSAVSGFVTDPLQYRLGIHGWRLRRLVDALERSFEHGDAQGYRPKDHYAARVFDFIDLLRTVAGMA
ncbi:MAG: hypothetical protein OEU36_13585 [Gammaproteobacteria bacterium]|nr:hypothetical protein [Gammaproteobacteria bacterium]